MKNRDFFFHFFNWLSFHLQYQYLRWFAIFILVTFIFTWYKIYLIHKIIWWVKKAKYWFTFSLFFPSFSSAGYRLFGLKRPCNWIQRSVILWAKKDHVIHLWFEKFIHKILVIIRVSLRIHLERLEKLCNSPENQIRPCSGQHRPANTRTGKIFVSLNLGENFVLCLTVRHTHNPRSDDVVRASLSVHISHSLALSCSFALYICKIFIFMIIIIAFGI